MSHAANSALERSEPNTPTGVGLHALVRHLDLFSGIGGFALAARMVGGIETAGFCEIDPWAQRMLEKNFPGIPIHNDIKTLKGNEYGKIDIITGGFPCQPWSAAGKRRGAADDRHLWPEMLRVINRCKPRWVLAENVSGIIKMALDDVLSDLEGEDYETGTLNIPAIGVDARHIRHRVWIVAHSRRGKQREPMHAEPLSSQWDSTKRPADQACRSSLHAGWSPWPSDAGIHRMADGIPHRIHRARGLGNAIVPQVAAEILRCMMCVDYPLPNDQVLTSEERGL